MAPTSWLGTTEDNNEITETADMVPTAIKPPASNVLKEKGNIAQVSEEGKNFRSEERRVGKECRAGRVTGVQTCALPISDQIRCWPIVGRCCEHRKWHLRVG